MSDISKQFTKQLTWGPILGNASFSVSEKKFDHIILGGMGGSHLSAGLLKIIKPGIDIYVHRSYGLPPFSDDFLKKSFVIASSYSGNTEETLSFYEEAQKNGLDVGVITSGGKLFDLAQKNGSQYVLLPPDIQPRDALGYFLKALVLFVNNKLIDVSIETILSDNQTLFSTDDVSNMVKNLSGKTPLIYSSLKNLPLAYIWKIKMNETAKTPAFCNVFPELNHNEMEGFDENSAIKNLAESFSCIFLEDESDHPRIIKRMEVMREILQKKNISVSKVNLNSESSWHTIAHAIELAHAVSQTLASEYGVDPDEVNLIEEFKKKIG